MECQIVSVVRGHHISKNFWTLVTGEQLTASTESSNHHDKFAVALAVLCCWTHTS